MTQLKKDNKCFCFSLFSYSEEELVVGSTWLLWYTATWNYQLCLFPPCLCFHMILSLKSNIAKTKPKPASEPTKPAWFFFWEAFCGVNGWWSCSLFLHSLSLRYLVCELWWVCLALLDRWLFLVESTFSFFHDIYLLLLLLLSSFVFSACSFSQPHKTPLLFFFFFLFLCFSIYISKLKVSHFLPGKSLL